MGVGIEVGIGIEVGGGCGGGERDRGGGRCGIIRVGDCPGWDDG